MPTSHWRGTSPSWLGGNGDMMDRDKPLRRLVNQEEADRRWRFKQEAAIRQLKLALVVTALGVLVATFVVLFGK